MSNSKLSRRRLLDLVLASAAATSVFGKHAKAQVQDLLPSVPETQTGDITCGNNVVVDAVAYRSGAAFNSDGGIAWVDLPNDMMAAQFAPGTYPPSAVKQAVQDLNAQFGSGFRLATADDKTSDGQPLLGTAIIYSKAVAADHNFYCAPIRAKVQHFFDPTAQP